MACLIIRPFIYYYVLLLSPALAAAQQVVVGGRVERERPPETPATFEERNASSPLNRTVERDSLALPLISALKVMLPRRVAAGVHPLPAYADSRLAHRVLWKFVPWQDGHAEFIERFAELAGEEKSVELERRKAKLFVWCQQQKLPHCAAFVLRDMIHHRGEHTANSLYQANLKRWRLYAAEHPSPYTFDLPLTGEWHALVDTRRHHQKKHWSLFAMDIVKNLDGRLHAGANVKENHYAWGQPVYAVADGVVIAAAGEHRDHLIGRPAPGANANIVRLDCGGGVFADYAHLMHDSVVVEKGQSVARGQLLGHVGNSGASGVPHLHFSMTDGDGFSISGRFRLRVLATRGWTELDGHDLQEGWHFMPIAH